MIQTRLFSSFFFGFFFGESSLPPEFIFVHYTLLYINIEKISNQTGRGIGSLLKGIGKFAAKNAPTNKSGNKTLTSLANSELLDRGASAISKKFGGRSATMKGSAAAKRQAKTTVRKLIKRYGVEGAKKILRTYVKTRGRGAVGKILGVILATILLF